MKIGIWGCGGFVGGTCYKAFKKVEEHTSTKVCGFDINKEKSFNTKKEVLSSNIVFVAVPTPMDKETGESYIGIVEDVVKEIRENNKWCMIVIKSTVPPGTTKMLHEKYGNVCFNPEFLTEANAYNDFIDLPYQIIGIPEKQVEKDCWGFPSSEGYDALNLQIFFDTLGKLGILKGSKFMDQIIIDSTEAEMVKYTRNCYLATRLSFFNEIKQICDKTGADYEVVKHFAGKDERVGRHYNNVDPKNPGWGLSCLPKDLNALRSLAKELDVKTPVLDGVWEKNLEVRKYRDWEEMEKAVKK